MKFFAAKMEKIKKTLRVGFSLAKVNFRLRTENSYLGIFWYLLNPLVMFAVLLLVKKAAFSEMAINFYPVYLLIGISAFNFFKSATTETISVINSNPDYLKSINQVNAESLVLGVVIQAAFSHAFEFLLIIIAAIYYELPFLGLIAYPLIFLLFIFLTLGLALIAATIGVYINDLNNIWIILAQLLFLASPIFYAIKAESLIYYFNLGNPLFHFLETARPLLISGTLALKPFTILAAASIISLLLGLLVFRRHKHKFAELL